MHLALNTIRPQYDLWLFSKNADVLYVTGYTFSILHYCLYTTFTTMFENLSYLNNISILFVKILDFFNLSIGKL